jgi:hypothetical protein
MTSFTAEAGGAISMWRARCASEGGMSRQFTTELGLSDERHRIVSPSELICRALPLHPYTARRPDEPRRTTSIDS